MIRQMSLECCDDRRPAFVESLVQFLNRPVLKQVLPWRSGLTSCRGRNCRGQDGCVSQQAEIRERLAGFREPVRSKVLEILTVAPVLDF